MGIKITTASKKEARVKNTEPRKSIFERVRLEALVKIDSEAADVKKQGSIQHAIGRYETGIADANPYASYNWKLPAGAKGKMSGQNGSIGLTASGDEYVELSVKAGGIRVPILDDPETGKENLTSIQIKASTLVEELRNIQQNLKDMKKEDEVGKAFHLAAIQAAKPKFKKGKECPTCYDYMEDQWVIFNESKSDKVNQESLADYLVDAPTMANHPSNMKMIRKVVKDGGKYLQPTLDQINELIAEGAIDKTTGEPL